MHYPLHRPVLLSARDRAEHFAPGGWKEIHTRIVPPEGYARVNVKEGSFGEYLRNLPLRSHGTKVHYFDGREKWNRSVYCAVVDMEIGKRDLQQCADAVIRLQAEYLYKHKSV